MVTALNDGAVNLFYDNSPKLATTATGIDVTGTVTADGLTVDGDATIQNTGNSYRTFTIGANRSASVNTLGRLDYDWDGTPVARIHAISGTDATNKDNGDLVLSTSADGTLKQRIFIDQGGDISFYEDTGTTAKFFWDADAELLKIGGLETTGTFPLMVKSNASNHGIHIEEASGNEGYTLGVDADGDLGFYNSGSATASVTFDDSGNVGIGTSSPNQPLTVVTNSSAQGINITGRSSDDRAYMFFSDNNGTTYRGSIHTIPVDNRFNINAYSGENITFSNNGAEKVRIDSSGNLLVGVTSTTLSGGSITLPNNGIIAFHDAGGSARNTLQFASGELKHGAAGAGLTAQTFYTNGSEHMRIDSSGNLLVGTTSTILDSEENEEQGVDIRPEGFVKISRSGNHPLQLARTDAGELIKFRSNEVTVGSIGSYAGSYLQIGSNNDGIAFGIANSIRPVDMAGAQRDAAIDLGDDTARFKDLYLSGGVVFGDAGGSGTSTSNTLDSYEEGTWIVNMYDALSGGNASSTQVTGRYTKIGQQVIASFDAFNNVSTSGLTAGNSVYFTLPFAASSTGRSIGSVQLDTVTFPSSGTMVTTAVVDSQSRATLNTSGSGVSDSTVKVQDFNGTSSDVVTWTLSYRTSS
jgi:hypothetical protein